MSAGTGSAPSGSRRADAGARRATRRLRHSPEPALKPKLALCRIGTTRAPDVPRELRLEGVTTNVRKKPKERVSEERAQRHRKSLWKRVRAMSRRGARYGFLQR